MNSKRNDSLQNSSSKSKPVKPFLTGTGPTRRPTLTSSSTDSVSKIVLTGSLPTIQSKRKLTSDSTKSLSVNHRLNTRNQSLTRENKQKNVRSTNPSLACSKKKLDPTSTSKLNDNQAVERSDTFTKQTIAPPRRPSKTQSLWHIENHSQQASVWRKFSSISNQIVPKNGAKIYTTESLDDEPKSSENKNKKKNNDDHNDNENADSLSLSNQWKNVRPRSFSFSTLNNFELLNKSDSSSESRASSIEVPPCEQSTDSPPKERCSSESLKTKTTCDVNTSPTPPPVRLEKTKSMTSVGTQVEMDMKLEQQNIRKSKSIHDNIVREPDWEFEYDPTTGRLVKRTLESTVPKNHSSPTSNRASLISSRYSSGMSDFNACRRCKDSVCCATIHSMSSRKSSLTHNEYDEFMNFDSQTSLNQTAMPVPYKAQQHRQASEDTSEESANGQSAKIRTKNSLIETENDSGGATMNMQTSVTKIDHRQHSPQPSSGIALQRQSVDNIASSLLPSTGVEARNPSIITGSAVNQDENNRFETLLRNNSFLHNAAHQANNLDAGANRKASTFEHFKTVPIGPIQVINDHPQGVNCLELSEDRSLLVSGGEDSVLRLWSTLSTPCECIGILVGHLSYITCATVYKLLVISGSADCTLKLWSIEDGNCLMTLKGHSAFINRVTCIGPLLLSSSFDATVRVWVLSDTLTIIQHENIHRDSETNSINKAINGRNSNANNSAKNSQDQSNENALLRRQTLNYQFGSHLKTLEGHQKSVTQVALVPNEIALLETGVLQELDIVVTTSTDGTARTWCLTSGEPRHILYGHSGPINCLVTDPNEGQVIYTAGSDAVIKCWDIVTGELLRDLKGHQSAVLCLISNNRILYSCSADHTVRAWAMEFGQCTRIYYRNTSAVTCCTYLRGILYTGSNDHSARIYDANSGVLRQTYTAHENAISAIAVVNGKLFTASFDGKILVWDVSMIQSEIASADTTINDHSTSILGKKLLANHPGLSSKIGATILNSTLDLFTQDYVHKLKNGTGKRSKSTLYPHLRRKSNSEAENAAKKVIRKTLGDKRGNNSNGGNNSSSSRNSWIGTMCGQRLWSRKSEASDKLVEQLRQINLNKARSSSKHKTKDFTAEIDPGILALIEQQNRSGNKKLGVTTTPNDDSMNVQRAVTALEPYLRSFNITLTLI